MSSLTGPVLVGAGLLVTGIAVRLLLRRRRS
jgi:LPXTG-motif cell wall-anchored protein